MLSQPIRTIPAYWRNGPQVGIMTKYDNGEWVYRGWIPINVVLKMKGKIKYE